MLAPLVPRILVVVAVCAALTAAASAHPSSGIVVDRHHRCAINADAKTQSGPPAKTLTLRLDGGLAFGMLIGAALAEGKKEVNYTSIAGVGSMLALAGVLIARGRSPKS